MKKLKSKINKKTILLVLIILIAAIIRLWAFPSIELVSWDEATYSNGGRWLAGLVYSEEPLGEIKEAIEQHRMHVLNPYNTPPLFPALISVFFLLFGVKANIAVLVSIIFGVLAVIIMYVFASELYGKKAGLIASALLAVTEYHMVYSRMALVDSTFLFFFMTSLYFYYKSFKIMSMRNFALAGLFTGICMNIKYNGFFPLIIAGIYFFFIFFMPFLFHKAKKDLENATKGLFISFLMIFLLYLPWLLILKFTVGFDKVYGNIMDHTFSNILLSFPFYANCMLLLVSLPILLFSLIGLFMLLKRRSMQDIFVLSWFLFIIFFLLLYKNYPRLFLPAVPALIIFSSLGIIRLSSLFSRYFLKSRKAAFLAFVLAIIVFFFALFTSVDSIVFQDDSYKLAGNYLNQNINKEDIVFFQTQDTIFFYTGIKNHAFGNNSATEEILSGNKTKYIITDLRIARNPFLKQFISEGNAVLIRNFRNNPNDVTFLNTISFGLLKKIRKNPENPEYSDYTQIKIYKIKEGSA